MSYLSEVLADSPVGFWRLDETSGTSVADASGNGRVGTYSGSPTLGVASLVPNGEGGTAVAFDGVDDRISIPDHSSLNAVAGAAFAFSIRVKITNPGADKLQVIADKTGLSQNNKQWCVFWDNRSSQGSPLAIKIQRGYNAGGSTVLSWAGATVRDLLAAGGRLMVVFTNVNTALIYWNNRLVASGATTAGGDVANTRALDIGHSNGSFHLEGTLDEATVFQPAGVGLVAARVNAQYAAELLAPRHVSSAPVKLTNDTKYNSFPGLVKCPNGDLLAVYRRGDNHTSGGTTGDLVAIRSTDNGATWGAASTIISDPAYDYGTASLSIVDESTIALVTWIRPKAGGLPYVDATRIYLSTDNGVTWGSPYTVDTGPTWLGKYSVSEDSLVKLGSYYYLGVWGEDASTGSASYQAGVMRSTDLVNWTRVAQFNTGGTNGYNEIGVALVGTKLVAVVRHESEVAHYTSTSSNGTTWTTPVKAISTSHGAPKVAGSSIGGLTHVPLRNGSFGAGGYMAAIDADGSISRVHTGIRGVTSTGNFIYGQSVSLDGNRLLTLWAEEPTEGATSAAIWAATYAAQISADLPITVGFEPAAETISGGGPPTTDATLPISIGFEATAERVQVPPSSYAQAVHRNSPLVYLRLDETSGTTAADSSGNNRPGTHNGGVAVGQAGLLTAGGKAAFYDGTDDYTRIQSSEGNGNWQDTDYASVTARIKTVAGTLSGDQFIASSWSGSGANNRFLFYVSNGKLTASAYTASGQTNCVGATTLVAGSEYSVGFSYDGTNIKVYLNGVQDGSVAKTGVLIKQTAQTTWAIEIARAAGSNSTCGEMTVDEFAYYGTALPASEFAAIHDAVTLPPLDSPADIPSLRAWYDASTLSLADGAAVSSWTDLSGNNAHATPPDAPGSPIYKTGILNGHNVVRFDGVNDYMDASALNGATTYTFALMFRVTSPMVDHQVPFQAGGNGSAAVLLNSAGNRAIYAPGNWVDYSGTTYTVSTWERWIVTMDGTSVKHYVNNVLVNTASATAVGDWVRIGAAKYTANHSLAEYRTGGDFAEIVTYNRALTGPEVADLDGYLAAKWTTPAVQATTAELPLLVGFEASAELVPEVEPLPNITVPYEPNPSSRPWPERPGWRYIAQRLNGDGTGTWIDWDVPLQDVRITKVCSGPNSLRASITPAVRRLLGDDGRPVLEEWSTAIYAQNEGEIHGFIVDRIAKEDSRLSLSAVGFSGYISGQNYGASNYWVETDPLDIARAIWDHFQAYPNGDIGLTLDRTTTTPVKIGTTLEQVEFDTQNGPVSFEAGPYKLNWWDTKDSGAKFDSLAKDTPFDYREWHRMKADGSDVEHFLDFSYPRIGRRRHDLRFALGENIHVVPSEEFDGSTYASQILVLGAGEGRTTVPGIAIRSNESRLRRIAVVEDKQIRSQYEANARAERELALRLGMGDITQVVVSNHRHAPIGSWVEGDEIRIQGDGSWGDIDLWVRVLSTEINPENEGNVTLSVSRVDKVA